MSQQVTLCSSQLSITDNIDHNLAQLEWAIDQAQGSDFLLTAEGSLSGYFGACTYYDNSKDRTVEQLTQQLVDRSVHKRTGLVLGTCRRDSYGLPRNSTRAWDRTGQHCSDYNKRLLTSTLWQTGDSASWCAGMPMDYSVWETDGVRYASLICNDVWAQPGVSLTGNPYYIQELVATYAVDVVFVSANCNDDPLDPLFRDWIDIHLRAQAREWGVWIIVSTSTRLPSGDSVEQMMLHSGCVSPRGEWLEQTAHTQSAVTAHRIHILPRTRSGNQTFYRPCTPQDPPELD